MTYKTKEYYRNKIKELSVKTKVSEIYITSKALELANKNKNEDNKKSHIGYYIIDNGLSELKKELNIKDNILSNPKKKEKVYIGTIITLTSLLTLITTTHLYNSIKSIIYSLLFVDIAEIAIV